MWIYYGFLRIELTDEAFGWHIDDCCSSAISDKVHDELKLVRDGKPKAGVSCKEGICWIRQIKGIFDQDDIYLGMLESNVPAGLVSTQWENNSE